MSSAALSAHASRSPFLVFAPYVERFVQGRRIAVLGDATTGLAAELGARGARLVHVYDVDKARAEQAALTLATRGVSYATLTEGDLGVRDGAFDVTIVPDATLFPNPAALLARARSLTSRQGLVLVATPNVEPEGAGATRFGYYELYDALSLQFSHVRMIGQVPFTGFALVDFGGEGEPQVSVDTSLAEASGPREPLYFVGLASGQPIEIDGYSLVELPVTQAAASEATAASSVVALAALEQERLAAAEARAERDRALSDLYALRESQRLLAGGPQAASMQAALERERREATVARAQLVDALAELEAMGEALRSAQQQAASAAPAEAVQALVEQERVAVAELAVRFEAARVELESVREARRVAEARAHEALRRADEIARELVETRAIAQQLEARLSEAARAGARGSHESAESRGRIETMMRQLAEQQEHAARLTQALAKAEDDRRRAQLREQAMAKTLAESHARGASPTEHEALRAQVERLNARLRERESQPRGIDPVEHEALRAQAAALKARIDDHEALRAQAAGLAARVRELEAEAQRVRHERDAEAQRAAERETEAARARSLEAEMASLESAQSRDLEVAEQTLRERAREILELRNEIDRRGALVRELLEALEAAGALPGGFGSPGEPSQGEPDTSSDQGPSPGAAGLSGSQAASNEGQAAGETSTRMAEAGGERSPAGQSPASEHERLQPAAGSSPALVAELEALRVALLEERKARQRAEAILSGGPDANGAAVLRAQVNAEAAHPG